MQGSCANLFLNISSSNAALFIRFITRCGFVARNFIVQIGIVEFGFISAVSVAADHRDQMRRSSYRHGAEKMDHDPA